MSFMTSIVPSVLIGRAHELSGLEQRLRWAAVSGAQVVLLEGETGIGKTRLLEEGVKCASSLGLQVFWGAAEQLEHTRPFGVVAEALDLRPSSSDPARVHIARLLTGGKDEEAEIQSFADAEPRIRYLILEAILELVENLAVKAPVLLVLEDLHWADSSSLLTLRALAQRLSHLGLVLLASFRPWPRTSEFHAAMEGLVNQSALHLQLNPLNDESVDALAADLMGAAPAENLREQLRRTKGNPLFVIELLRALDSEGLLKVVDGRVEMQPVNLPHSLNLILLRRLSYLPKDTRQMLQVASVLGSSFNVVHLRLATGHATTELMPALENAVQAEVLEENEGRLVFRHDLIREAIYNNIPPSIRASLHLEVAQKLAEIEASAIQVAEHFSLGALPGDKQAIRWLHEAAMGASQRAPAVAVELLKRALEIAGPQHPMRDSLIADLVIVSMWAGHPQKAEVLARETLGRKHNPTDVSKLRLGLIRALLAQGKTFEGYRESEIALQQLDLSDLVRVRLQAEAAWGRLFGGDLEGAAALAEAAREAAEQLRDSLGMCTALCALSVLELNRCHPSEGVALATRAVAEADRSEGKVGHQFYCNLILAFALMTTDRLSDADEAIQNGRRVSEQLGLTVAQCFYQWGLVHLRFFDGRWDDAITEAETAVALADEVGARLGLVSVHSAIAMIALHRNDFHKAEQELARAEAEFATGPAPYVYWLMWARALLEEAQGNLAQALMALEDAWDRSMAADASPDLIRLYLESGKMDLAFAVSQQIEQVAARTGIASDVSSALRCQGLTNNDADILRQAVIVARQSPRPLMRALTSEDAGVALSRAGRCTEAIPLLEEALVIYEQLDAVRGAARVEAQLRSLGVRRRRRATRSQRQTSGWDSLTPTELRVVSLIAEGLTNRAVAKRLFISPRTVETHVAHVFAKLGVSSRAALIAKVVHRHAKL
jgi:DNA-binding CsgD family transcriptional regulator